MADAARGRRIKELREARGLTGPQVVELMRNLGGLKANGAPFVSYRQYQKYEAGGGIGLDKLRVLCDVLGTTQDYILRGEGERRQPRDARADDRGPVSVSRLDGELEQRIHAIEETLAGIVTLLQEARSEQDNIRGMLDEQTSLLKDIRQARGDADDAAARLDAAVREADRALRSAPPTPPANTAKTTRKSNPRAAR